MALALAISGAFLAPTLAAIFVLTGTRARAGAITETFAWLTSSFLVGSAAGAALGGTLTGSRLRRAGLRAGRRDVAGRRRAVVGAPGAASRAPRSASNRRPSSGAPLSRARPRAGILKAYAFHLRVHR